MLPKSEHVQQFYHASDNSLLSAGKSATSRQETKLFIECSTIDPMVTREVGEKVKASRLGEYADAAVSVCSLSWREDTRLAKTVAGWPIWRT